MSTPVPNEDNANTRKEFAKRAEELYEGLIKKEFEKILDTCPIVSGLYVIDDAELGQKRGNDRYRVAIEKHLAGIYPKANLVDSPSIPRTTEQLKKAILRNVNPGDYEGMGAILTDAEHEVEIYLNKQFAEVNVTDVLTKFSKAPYGWDNICTLYVINELVRRHNRDYTYTNNPNVETQRENCHAKCTKKTYTSVINAYMNGIQPNMLVTIMNLREVSEHPYLYDSALTTHDINELVSTSARLQATIKFLDSIKEKEEKVIIFVERKETQKMLQKLCNERYGIICKIINGDTPSIIKRHSFDRQTRQASINEFQAVDGFNVIIMSPVAAGMGLNVTAANHVIHYSRHWNPAKESQATDRAYRIGQTKDVYVYYPMAVTSDIKTFDEILDDLLSRKTSLATSTIFLQRE